MSANIINAGDGRHEHPSQALLDAYSIQQSLGTLAGLRVLILGDVLHSRVALSNSLCFTKLGAVVRLCGPKTLIPPYAEHVNVLVIRHPDAGVPHFLSRHLSANIINAGDGRHEHPSQALLDAYSIQQSLGTLAGLRVLILGDVLHSRVALSNSLCFTKLGAVVRLCGPKTLIPPYAEHVNVLSHVNVLVIRHPDAGVPHFLSRHLSANIINAGDGRHEHPSQALLDAYSIQQSLGTLAGLRVLILGDVLHSRVALSNSLCFTKLGAVVRLCGPKTLIPPYAEHVNVLVIRHPDAGVPHFLSRHLSANIINAGDGRHEHPSQALLDAYSIQQSLGTLAGLRVLILGDVLHSRVALSNSLCFTKLGAVVRLCGPKTLIPPYAEHVNVLVIRHPDAGVPHFLSRHLSANIINAGDGRHEHPSQALLDAYSIQQSLGTLAGLRVLILGDVLHSRVALSNSLCFTKLGAVVRLCGPKTLIPPYAEHVNVLVIRHPDAGVPHFLSRHLSANIINAGDGRHEHPSQALLDAYSIQQSLGTLAGLRVLILGDVLHSRVALSKIFSSTKLGAVVRLCGPKTLIPPYAEHVNVLVIRHPDAGVPHFLSRHLSANIINAGDGRHEHPSQALLDAYSIQQSLGTLAGLRVLILGDVLHSRVALSNSLCFTKLGAVVRLCGPKTLIPPYAEHVNVLVIRHPDAGVPHFLSRHLSANIINAGDGRHEHPSQALLDALPNTAH